MATPQRVLQLKTYVSRVEYVRLHAMNLVSGPLCTNGDVRAFGQARRVQMSEREELAFVMCTGRSHRWLGQREEERAQVVASAGFPKPETPHAPPSPFQALCVSASFLSFMGM
jgi:uncharacterized RmlC-like cupin family protein